MKILKNRIIYSIIVTLLITGILIVPYYIVFNNVIEVIRDVLGKEITNVSITNSIIQEILDRIKNVIIISFLFLVLITSIAVNKLLYMRSEALDIDYLTGLYSKRYHENHLDRVITNTQLVQKPLSLIMIDVDNFKEINDQYGHIVGDKVLKFVAQNIQTNIRSVDICSRYGGDEFIIILPGIKHEIAASIVERIREKVSMLELNMEGEKEPVHTSLSIGIAEWNPGMSAEKLTKCADEAMYISKNNGKNITTIYKESGLVYAR